MHALGDTGKTQGIEYTRMESADRIQVRQEERSWKERNSNKSMYRIIQKGQSKHTNSTRVELRDAEGVIASVCRVVSERAK